MYLKAIKMRKNEEVILNCTSNKAIKKRLINEYKLLFDTYDDIEVKFTENNLVFSVLEIINNNKFVYGFKIEDNYPFVPPKIFYQNRPYIDYLKIENMNILNQLKSNFGIDCFYCSSYACKNNWSPAVTINHIINEIKKFKNYKNYMLYKLFSIKIKDKYLIDDIDILSWIF